mgnify:CR=1 FL=1
MLDKLFLSTPSARRATSSPIRSSMEICNFYPRPPRGGRQQVKLEQTLRYAISIHALREEGDPKLHETQSPQKNFYPRPPRGGRPKLHETQSPQKNFYPRPPRGGRPPASRRMLPPSRIFLSTPSARRATRSAGWRFYRWSDFYPRPPRGGRLEALKHPGVHGIISIHALREEGDAGGLCRAGKSVDFYPRPPRGGRPLSLSGKAADAKISIHALREEGDLREKRPEDFLTDFYPRPPRGGRQLQSPTVFISRYFYPRPPRGGRHLHPFGSATRSIFLSTPSARRATRSSDNGPPRRPISIHALREEGD